MSQSESHEQRLQRLRRLRVRPEPDWSLGFLKKQFKLQVEKPYKQLGDLGILWAGLVPVELAEHTSLEGFQRGVLHVAVDCSVRLYELDRLLRGGLHTELIRRHKGGTLRRVQLRVAPVRGSPIAENRDWGPRPPGGPPLPSPEK